MNYWVLGFLVVNLFASAALYATNRSYETGILTAKKAEISSVFNAAYDDLPYVLPDNITDYPFNRDLNKRISDLPYNKEILIVKKESGFCKLRSQTHFIQLKKRNNTLKCPTNWRKIFTTGEDAGYKLNNYGGQDSYYQGRLFDAETKTPYELGKLGEEFLLILEVSKKDLHKSVVEYKNILASTFLIFLLSTAGISFHGNKITKEKALKSKEMTDILDSVDYGFVRINLDEDPEKRKINFVNPAFCDMFGYSKEELIGQSELMIVPDRYIEDHKEGVASLAKGNESNYLNKGIRQTMYGKRKDGSEFPMTLLICEVETAEGKNIFGGIFDQTELMKERAEKERLAIELEQAVALLAE